MRVHLLPTLILTVLAVSPKVILLPLGILAFLVFLLLVGAFGLFCALAIIGSAGWVFGRLTGRSRPQRSGPRRRPFAALGRRLLFRR